MTAIAPDDLARIEERQRIFRLRGLHVDELIELDVPALVAGVRSLQARITELEGARADAWDEGAKHMAEFDVTDRDTEEEAWANPYRKESGK